jgi:methylphosphotriester-DNA--protein-cysteine methyltransferase
MRAREFLAEGPIWDMVKRTARKLFGMGASRSVLNKKATEALANSMQSIGKSDYDSIDRQMQLISKEFKMTPQKLHDVWVRQYGVTPDRWIKKRI